MCGIFGFSLSKSEPYVTAKRMGQVLHHRGPDNYGIWVDKAGRLALGHTRLAILELSEAGSQPMVSSCGRYIIALNGEIYNHLSLRDEISQEKKLIWRGSSDTETLVECIAKWGLERTLRKTIGMFAIALWDTHENILSLARDRLGEKPLYWGWSHNLLVFASELKAIKAHSEFNALIDRNALTLFLRHGYVPAPHSIYQGIHKLLPGHFISIPIKDDAEESKGARPVPYWTLRETIQDGKSNLFKGTPDEAVDLLDKQLRESISDQLISDVPLGAFLSGGVDSSTVVALMQLQSDTPVQTYTLGFHEQGYNEAEHAKAVAKHLGTEHTELYVTADDALNVIPKLSTIHCEPFADSSQIPAFLVSQLARQHVTVALSGDGGDELFGGYNRYLAAQKVWRPIKRMPNIVRQFTAGALSSLSPNTWDKLFNFASPALPKRLRLSIPGEKARKLSEVLTLDSGEEFYRQLTSFWTDPESIVIDSVEPSTIITNSSGWPEADCLEHRMMALDSLTYLPDDILVKVDRAAMANSLETRTPFLDHRLVELAWRMPMDFKIRHGQGKWLLRQVLYKYVPKELIERPKAGFGVPLESWLRGPLRDWAEDLLSESRLSNDGYFHVAPIRKMWNEHLSKKKNWQYHLWNILMFQAWLNNEKEQK